MASVLHHAHFCRVLVPAILLLMLATPASFIGAWSDVLRRNLAAAATLGSTQWAVHTSVGVEMRKLKLAAKQMAAICRLMPVQCYTF